MIYINNNLLLRLLAIQTDRFSQPLARRLFYSNNLDFYLELPTSSLNHFNNLKSAWNANNVIDNQRGKRYKNDFIRMKPLAIFFMRP